MSRGCRGPRPGCVRTLLSLALLFVAAAAPAGAGGGPVDRPRVVVVVALPGLRADYLDRVLPHLGQTGFRRILRRGARFTRARTGLAFPETAPATATLVTGAWPRRHGVVADRWWDRARRRPVGPCDEPAMVPTLVERLEASTEGKARTIVVAWSESVAQVAGGAAADLSCWFAPDAGALQVRGPGAERAADASGQAASASDDWVKPFLSPRRLRRWRGKKWVRCLPRWQYAECAEDDRAEEHDEHLGTRFPHTLPEDDAALAEVLGRTPFADRLLTEFTVGAILKEQVGRDDVTDLLVLVPESVGHIGRRFGPGSHETTDALARLDRQLGILLAVLDSRAGAGCWSIVLTGLNGMPPLASEAADRGLTTSTWPESVAALSAAGGGSCGAGDDIDPVVPEALVFDAEREPMIWIGSHLWVRPGGWPTGAPPAGLVPDVHVRLRRLAGVHAVVTPAHFGEDRLPAGRLGRLLRRSFHPERAGDLIVVPGAGAVRAGRRGPIGPWPHSDAVVMMAMGRGIRRGTFEAPVTLAAVAPIVRRLLGVEGEDEPDAGRAHGALRDPQGDAGR